MPLQVGCGAQAIKRIIPTEKGIKWLNSLYEVCVEQAGICPNICDAGCSEPDNVLGLTSYPATSTPAFLTLANFSRATTGLPRCR